MVTVLPASTYSSLITPLTLGFTSTSRRGTIEPVATVFLVMSVISACSVENTIGWACDFLYR